MKPTHVTIAFTTRKGERITEYLDDIRGDSDKVIKKLTTFLKAFGALDIVVEYHYTVH